MSAGETLASLLDDVERGRPGRQTFEALLALPPVAGGRDASEVDRLVRLLDTPYAPVLVVVLARRGAAGAQAAARAAVERPGLSADVATEGPRVLAHAIALLDAPDARGGAIGLLVRSARAHPKRSAAVLEAAERDPEVAAALRPALQALLEHVDDATRGRALRLLEEREPLLLDTRGYTDRAARHRVAELLVRDDAWSRTGQASRLARRLADSGPEVRVRLLRRLARMLGPACADLLRPRLADPDPRARALAAWMLGKLGVYADFLPLLDDPDWRVRAAAAWSLGRTGDARSVPALRKTLWDPVLPVGRAALRALERLLPSPTEDVVQAREVLGAGRRR